MKRFTVQNPATEIRQYQGRVIVIACLIGILLAGLIARLVYLQVVQYRYYLTLSHQNLLTAAPIEPSRGLIYDRNGVLLAGNTPVFSLELIPDKVKNIKKTIQALSSIIHFSDADLQAFQKSFSPYRKYNPAALKVKLTEEERAIFALNQYRFPGVFIQAHLIRYYPYAALMAPVLGYVGRINAEELAKVDADNYSASNYIGKSGIEKFYENILHGKIGLQQLETSAAGDVLRSTENRPATAGQNLYLTIDARLQKIAADALKDTPGAVVMMDPHTGEILAFVSNPSFDPNLFVAGISNSAYHTLANDPNRPLFNRILQAEFPSGSTVKLFYALGMLGANVINPSYTVYDPGFFKLSHSEHVFHCWKRTGHGTVNVESAIIQSCDVYFWRASQLAGIERMDKILKTFGFGEAVGIDSTGERKGLVPSPEWKMRVHHQPWYPGDTVSVAIGQGYFLVTPLQLVTALMRLVDKGGGYQPHLLLKNESPAGQTVNTTPVPLKPIQFPDADWNLVLKATREIVTDPRGTGYTAGHTAKYTYAGKSGTAQVFSLKGNQQDKANLLPKKLRDHSWFISFAPANNPQIVMVVFLEHSGEGPAAFVTRNILDNYFKLFPLPLKSP